MKEINLDFFKGLLPSVSKFDENQFLEFQGGVIALIQKIRNKTRSTHHDGQYSHQTHLQEEYIPTPISSTPSPYSNVSNMSDLSFFDL